MEKVIYKNPAYNDVVRPVSASELEDQEFRRAQQSVDAVFREVGATVISDVSYAGEQPAVRLFIHDKQSEAMTNFNNRPA